MNNPKLSVCIPVYNGEEFIKITIESVLSQSFKDFELVIIDNKSTDSTIDIINGFSDPRIKLVKNETNIGLLGNWNKALELANGTYVKLLPADDVLYQDCFAKQVEAFEKDKKKEISLVCCSRAIIDENGKTILVRKFSGKEGIINGFKAINKVVRSGGNIIGEGGCVMFRKEILKTTGLFNADILYVVDLDLWFKMLLLGNLYSIPKALSGFRISAGSASVQIIDKHKYDYFHFIQNLYKNKTYKLKYINFILGSINSFILINMKKVLYRYQMMGR